jgi:uncharacterized OB-fold protein
VTREQVPIAEGLFTWPSDDPHLIASRCEACTVTAFPALPECPGCGASTVSEVLLDRRGSLWTWTTQSFPPVSPPYRGTTAPDMFEPFGIGWVQLGGQVMVEARLTENDPEKLAFDMPVELVIAPIGTDDDGNEIMSFAFEPVH